MKNHTRLLPKEQALFCFQEEADTRLLFNQIATNHMLGTHVAVDSNNADAFLLLLRNASRLAGNIWMDASVGSQKAFYQHNRMRLFI